MKRVQESQQATSVVLVFNACGKSMRVLMSIFHNLERGSDAGGDSAMWV